MRIIGCDPGLASFGLAVAVLEERVRVERVEVLRTEASARARRIRKADDNSERARALARELLRVLDGQSVVAICVEAVALPFGRVQHSVVSNLGRVRGLLDALAEVYEVPIIEETPQALKRLITGRGDASKEEVRRALNGNICRCGTYRGVRRAVVEAALKRKGGQG